MEWRYLGVLAVLMLVVASLGCLNPPAPPPMSRIPKVIIDYVEDDGFAVYVHGMSDYRYERIEIVVNNETLYARNSTFQGSAITHLTVFALNITVTDRPYDDEEVEIYYYNATISLESAFLFTVEDPYSLHEIDLESTTYFITTMYLSGTEPEK